MFNLATSWGRSTEIHLGQAWGTARPRPHLPPPRCNSRQLRPNICHVLCGCGILSGQLVHDVSGCQFPTVVSSRTPLLELIGLVSHVAFEASKAVCCRNCAGSRVNITSRDIAVQCWWWWLADLAAIRTFSPPCEESNVRWPEPQRNAVQDNYETELTRTARETVSLLLTCNRNFICLAFCICTIPWCPSPYAIM